MPEPILAKLREAIKRYIEKGGTEIAQQSAAR
jgi:hypothetical protein